MTKIEMNNCWNDSFIEHKQHKTTKSDIYKIDPRKIIVQEGFNSRSNFGDLNELAAQIKEQGVLNPISVIPFKDENGEEKYRLVDGERRYRAVMKLLESGVEIARIPALYLSKSTSEEELLIQQALRNEGKPFNPYEWGILARKLMDKCGLTISEVATKLGKNVGAMSRYVGYLELEPKLSNLLKEDKISGPNLTRILEAHGGDQESAYNEIMGLEEKRVEKGKEHISLKDLDTKSRTILFKDSKAIKSGLKLLYKYAEEYRGMSFKLKDVYDFLNDGLMIDEAFESAVEKMKKAE